MAMYETVIGLEIHVQLATQSKAFCTDAAAFGAAPNTQTSVVSLAHPGTLPRLNEQAVEYAIRLGLALGCRINLHSTFDRKNYFYADLPKGYQITQDANPICQGGQLTVDGGRLTVDGGRLTVDGGRLTVDGGQETIVGQQEYSGKEDPSLHADPPSTVDRPPSTVRIHHIHLEEDAGKSVHDQHPEYSLIDLNRAGVPLLEIVTEPDLRSADEAATCMEAIRRLVRWLGISDGNMEEGSLRCDVNVSVRKKGAATLGNRCEIKNINSMRFARKAIAFEEKRQIEILESGSLVEQETRGFDPARGVTFSLREKEDAHDYRYFPEPDLPPVVVSPDWLERIRAAMPPLPWELEQEFQSFYSLPVHDSEQLVQDRQTAMYFQELVSEKGTEAKLLANLLIHKLLPWCAETGTALVDCPVSPAQWRAFTALMATGTISATAANQRLFPALLEQPDVEPVELAERLQLLQTSDTDILEKLATEVLDRFPDKVAAYQNGKKGLLGFFMGELMKASGGKADPQAASRILEQRLADSFK